MTYFLPSISKDATDRRQLLAALERYGLTDLSANHAAYVETSQRLAAGIEYALEWGDTLSASCFSRLADRILCDRLDDSAAFAVASQIAHMWDQEDRHSPSRGGRPKARPSVDFLFDSRLVKDDFLSGGLLDNLEAFRGVVPFPPAFVPPSFLLGPWSLWVVRYGEGEVCCVLAPSEDLAFGEARRLGVHVDGMTAKRWPFDDDPEGDGCLFVHRATNEAADALRESIESGEPVIIAKQRVSTGTDPDLPVLDPDAITLRDTIDPDPLLVDEHGVYRHPVRFDPCADVDDGGPIVLYMACCPEAEGARLYANDSGVVLADDGRGTDTSSLWPDLFDAVAEPGLLDLIEQALTDHSVQDIHVRQLLALCQRERERHEADVERERKAGVVALHKQVHQCFEHIVDPSVARSVKQFWHLLAREVAGVDSIKAMTYAEIEAVMVRLEEEGFRPDGSPFESRDELEPLYTDGGVLAVASAQGREAQGPFVRGRVYIETQETKLRSEATS